jgi:hypothetical protein
MTETYTNSSGQGSGEQIARKQLSKSELISLYERLSKVEKESDDYEQILRETQGVRELMEGHAKLFSALMDEVDRERVVELQENLSVVHERICAQIKELLAMDLTFAEVLRINRLVDMQIKTSRARAAKVTQKPATKPEPRKRRQ